MTNRIIIFSQLLSSFRCIYFQSANITYEIKFCIKKNPTSLKKKTKTQTKKKRYSPAADADSVGVCVMALDARSPADCQIISLNAAALVVAREETKITAAC